MSWELGWSQWAHLTKEAKGEARFGDFVIVSWGELTNS